MVLSSTLDSTPQSLTSRLLREDSQPITPANHAGVKTYFASSDEPEPTSTEVQPAHAGARLMSVPQINGANTEEQ